MLGPLALRHGGPRADGSSRNPALRRSRERGQKTAPAQPIDLGRFGNLTPRVQYYWQDDTWYRGFNRTPEDSGENAPFLNSATAHDLQPAYHQTDVKLIWSLPDERWTAEVFVRNLEDQVVYQNVLVSTPLLDSPQMAWYGAPRVYGFRVGVRY